MTDPVCQQCFSDKKPLARRKSSTRLRRQLQLTVINMPFLAVVFVGKNIVQLFHAPKKKFSCLRDISCCELVKGVFPGFFLLCLSTVLNK